MEANLDNYDVIISYGEEKRGYMIDRRATETFPFQIVSAEPDLPEGTTKVEGGEDPYTVRDLTDFRRIVFNDFHGGTGQLTRDRSNAVYNQFYESTAMDISRSGKIAPAAKTAALFNDDRTFNVCPFVVEAGDYVYAAFLPDGTGSTNQHQVRFWDNESESLVAGAWERDTSLLTPSYFKPCSGIDSTANPLCLATDGDLVYVALDNDGVWRGNALTSFTQFSTENGIVAMAYAGGYLYGIQDDGTSQTIGYFSSDGSTFTPLPTTGAMMPLSRTFGLVKVGNWVYWGQVSGNRSWVNAAIASDENNKPRFELFSDLPEGFVATTLHGYIGDLYMGGHYVWPEADSAKGAIYKATSQGTVLLCHVGHDPHGEMRPLRPWYDHRVIAMKAFDRYLYILTAQDLWRWDLKDGGLSEVCQNIWHPDTTLATNTYPTWTPGAPGEDPTPGTPTTTTTTTVTHYLEWLGAARRTSFKVIGPGLPTIVWYEQLDGRYWLGDSEPDGYWQYGWTEKENPLASTWTIYASLVSNGYRFQTCTPGANSAGVVESNWTTTEGAVSFTYGFDPSDDLSKGITVEIEIPANSFIRGPAAGEVSLHNGFYQANMRICRHLVDGAPRWYVELLQGAVSDLDDLTLATAIRSSDMTGVNGDSEGRFTAGHTLRLTLKGKEANVYLDGRSQPLISCQSCPGTEERCVRWGGGRWSVPLKSKVDLTYSAVRFALGVWPGSLDKWSESIPTEGTDDETTDDPGEVTYNTSTTVMDTGAIAVWKGKIFWPVFKKAWCFADYKLRAETGTLITSMSSGGAPDVEKTFHSVVITHEPLKTWTDESGLIGDADESYQEMIEVQVFIDGILGQHLYQKTAPISYEDSGGPRHVIDLEDQIGHAVGIKLIAHGYGAGPVIDNAVVRWWPHNNRRLVMVLDVREGARDRTGAPLTIDDEVIFLLGADEGHTVRIETKTRSWDVHIEDLQLLEAGESSLHRSSLEQGRVLLRGRIIES